MANRGHFVVVLAGGRKMWYNEIEVWTTIIRTICRSGGPAHP